MRHFVHDFDISQLEQRQILDTALAMKRDPSASRRLLEGRVLAMIFQKSSTRTRVSFEAGMVQLGGQAIFLSSRDIQIGRGEPIGDTGRVLSRYVDLIMIRTFAHAEVRALADASTVPVINGLDDLLHPCQALADLLTIREHLSGDTRAGKTDSDLTGRRLVYIGDGNNMTHSLMLAGARAGLSVRVVTPEGYAPQAHIVTDAQKEAARTGATIEVGHDPREGIRGADVVYTDVWASMGQEAEADARRQAFAQFTVDAALMRHAQPNALFMHCLPAHRGEEVAAEVIDGPQSVVFDQAENRLHAQKALMAFLLEAIR